MVKTELLNCLREEQKHNTLKKVSNINQHSACYTHATSQQGATLAAAYAPSLLTSLKPSFIMHGASVLATSLSLKQLAHDPMCFVLSRLETRCQV